MSYLVQLGGGGGGGNKIELNLLFSIKSSFLILDIEIAQFFFSKNSQLQRPMNGGLVLKHGL